MNLVTREFVCRSAPLRLAVQYRDRMDIELYNGHTPQADYDRLIASDLTKGAIDTIMGNSSWTRLMCNACGNDVERTVAVDVTGGEYSTQICEECVNKMKELLP